VSIAFSGKEILQIINELVNIPSPSGYTEKIITHIETYLGGIGLKTYRNRKGALITTLPGSNTKQHRLLTGPCRCFGSHGQGDQR